MARRQVAAELGDGGVVVGQLLLDRDRLAVLGLRFRWLARIRQQGAEVVNVTRQVAAEFGDGGVVVGQLLQDCDALRHSAAASDDLPVSSAGWRVRRIVPARPRRDSTVAPGAAASAS